MQGSRVLFGATNRKYLTSKHGNKNFYKGPSRAALSCAATDDRSVRDLFMHTSPTHVGRGAPKFGKLGPIGTLPILWPLYLPKRLSLYFPNQEVVFSFFSFRFTAKFKLDVDKFKAGTFKCPDLTGFQVHIAFFRHLISLQHLYTCTPPLAQGIRVPHNAQDRLMTFYAHA
jgi:hypothetical protein